MPSVSENRSLRKVTQTPICTHHRLSSGLRTDSRDFMTRPFLLSISVFVFSFLHYFFVFFGSVRQIKLATRQLLGARKYSLSYRIVVDVFYRPKHAYYG